MKTQLTYLLILFSVASYSQKSNSLGIETGLHTINNRNYGSNDPERFFPITDNSLYLAIPFEHHWTKKNSLIFKPILLTNKDLFWVKRISDGSDYRVKSSLNYLRLSVSLSRKFGNPDKFYGILKMGVGMGTYVSGSYDLSEYDILSNQFVSTHSIKPRETSLLREEFFSEGAIGGGIKIHNNMEVQLSVNYLVAFDKLNFNTDVPFSSLEEYSMVHNHTFKSNFYGLNVTVLYNFIGDKKDKITQ